MQHSGVIFRDITYENDFNEIIKVPIHYSPQEKWLEMIESKADYDANVNTEITLPRMGFELSSIDFDGTRMLNPMNKIKKINLDDKQYMFNRIPYNFTFSLYLATRKFEDSLKIIEQIVPFFTPDMNLSIKDMGSFDIVTDVPILLTSMSFSIDWQGGIDSKRTILWTFNFIAKAWLYSNIREQNRIKETIVQMGDAEFNDIYRSLINLVEPRSSDKQADSTIKTFSINGPAPVKLSLNFDNTSDIVTLNTFEKVNRGYNLSLKPVNVGTTLTIIQLC